ncbi:hypothetical protein GKS22_05885 [Streptococcus uberis]|uniref:hypothetical protein n=1 Tax=Streptococcus uberis TaxID=1349 RepID=UPI0012B50F97|nr:hypothetical protein [Streptococcus uberis]MTB43256.1 hypothetical protein [Streptococcus uberis]MTB56888.1 hypothetical protein [Streptococcus uberis]
MQLKTKIITQTHEWYTNNTTLDKLVNDFIADKDFVSVNYIETWIGKHECLRTTAFITYQESK